MYTDILRRLGDAVRRKCPEKWRTNFWFLLHDNAPTHLSVLVKDFLAKNKVTTMEHPPYSPDLATANVYLFPQLKSGLKERRFCDATDNIKNATEELKRFPQNDFPLSDAYSYTRRLFWRKCSLSDCTVLYFSEIEWFQEHFEATANTTGKIMCTYIANIYDGFYSNYVFFA